MKEQKDLKSNVGQLTVSIPHITQQINSRWDEYLSVRKQKQNVWEGSSTYDFKDKKTDRFDVKHNTYWNKYLLRIAISFLPFML